MSDVVKPAYKVGQPLQVTEGVEGTWRYHLSPAGSFVRSLCGRRTMRTSITPERWGRTPANYHIPEKWCAEYATIAHIAPRD